VGVAHPNQNAVKDISDFLMLSKWGISTYLNQWWEKDLVIKHARAFGKDMLYIQK
jgi:hypothetical protein